MSDGAAQARVRRSKREKRRWAHRENAIRVLRSGATVAVQSNSALPRPAKRAQSTYTASRGVVMKVLEAESKLLSNAKLGRMAMMSVREICRRSAKYTESGDPLSLRTVCEAIAILIRQHSIVQWDALSSQERPRTKGDGFGKGCYRLPTFVETLERRRNDKRVGISLRGYMYVLGKERRLLTQAEVDSWNLDEGVVVEMGDAVEPPAGYYDSVDAAETQASVNPEATGSSPPAEPLPGVVWNALKASIRDKSFSKATARQLVAKARAHAIGRGEIVTDADIVQAIAIGHTAAGRRGVGNIGYYDRTLPEKIDALLDARQDERTRETALAAAREEALAAPPLPDFGFVVSTVNCKTCGGKIETYSTGLISWCRCGAPAAVAVG